MAKNQKGAGAVEEPQTGASGQSETALVVQGSQSQAMQTLDGVDQSDSRGKEAINAEDVILPFLAICQKTSPQLEADNAKYIDGIRFLDLFNSLTGEKYGPGPLRFIPLILKKHAIEFNDFKDGGGIKDRNVPWDDERCQFHEDEKPVATRFYDWAVLLLPTMELIVLSFKSTNIGVAKQFQQIVNLRKGPAFAGQYEVRTVSAKNNFGTFGKFAIQPAGKPTQEQFDFASEVYESIKLQNIVVEHEAEREPGQDDDAGPVVAGTVVEGGEAKTPF